MAKYMRRRTKKKGKRRAKKRTNSLINGKVGGFYRTSYTETYPLITTANTLAWAPMTVNLLTGIEGGVDGAQYKDPNSN